MTAKWINAGIALLAAGAFMTSGCDTADDAAEETGDTMEEAYEATGRTLEKAGDETMGAMEEAGDEIEEAGDDMAQ